LKELKNEGNKKSNVIDIVIDPIIKHKPAKKNAQSGQVRPCLWSLRQTRRCGLGGGSGRLWRALIKSVCQESDN